MDPATVRFTSVDPHAENYYSWSPYVYAGNNPINAIDPDGKDWQLSITRNKAGEITGVQISAKVYITGVNASADRAKELNKAAGNTYKTQKVDGVSVSFNINYEYKKNISKND